MPRTGRSFLERAADDAQHSDVTVTVAEVPGHLRVGVLASAGFCHSVCAAESNTPESTRLFPSDCP